jgi:hypothetical protein
MHGHGEILRGEILFARPWLELHRGTPDARRQMISKAHHSSL